MQLSSYALAVGDDLQRIAAVGGEETARAAELLTVALESSLTRRLQEALTEAALELTAQLPHGRVEVRIAGDDPELVYVEDDGPRPADAADEAFGARITLRLPDSLKSRVDAAASAAGISVNTWLVQTLGRELESRSTTSGGRRLTGYGRS